MEHIINNSVYYFIKTGEVYYHPELWKRIMSFDGSFQWKATITPRSHIKLLLENARESGRKLLDGEMYWLPDLGFWLRMTTKYYNE